MKNIKTITVNNKTLHIEIADTFWRRFCGLMGRPALPENTGLLLAPCNTVHTFFMRFSLDLVFLHEEGYVIKILKNCRPWRVFPAVAGAFYVLELMAGKADEVGLTEGTQVLSN